MAEEPRQGPPQRGLQAIETIRAERSSKLRVPPPKFWAWVGVVLAVTFVIHWKRSANQVERDKAALLARQRGVEAELGPRWTSLRTRIETWTSELAKDAPDHVDEATLKEWTFRDKPGIYLRLRVEDAKTPESIRAAAKESLRDAFTACLGTANNPSPLAGAECKKSSDCPRGEFCNELDRCARPAQPFNMRIAYRALQILSPEWVRDVQESSGDLRIKVLAASFDEVLTNDLPLAMELLVLAKYALVVLDETPEGAPKDPPDGGTITEAVQAMPHFARVGVWRLEDDKLVLRVRREAAGRFVGGAPAGLDPEVGEARQRQANSCSLAMSVREAMGDPNVVGDAPPPQ